MERVIIIIPARMNSSRFPGKPLAKVLGMTMITHILKRCELAKCVNEVYVATCDDEIFQEIQTHNGKAIMTKDSHERCTDRIEEAANYIKPPLNDNDIVIMVQGDEILINPNMIDQLHQSLINDDAPISNLISPIAKENELSDINVVKIVTDKNNNAMYLSRSALPSITRVKEFKQGMAFQQMGVIGFRFHFLKKFSQLPTTSLEKIESIDMLRVLENGIKLKTVKTNSPTIAVDVPQELEDAINILKVDPMLKLYCK